MAVREILQLGDPFLRKKCKKVTKHNSKNVLQCVADLRDTLQHTRFLTGYGRGIAAPQIGYDLRVVFLGPEVLGKELVLCNPVIINKSKGKFTVWDSCLCFLSIFMKVERHKFITVQYQDLNGLVLELKAGPENDLSELLQHEIDHLDGKLCVDYVDPSELVSRCIFEKRYMSESPYA